MGFLFYFLKSQLFLSCYPLLLCSPLLSPYLSLSASLFVFLPTLTPSFSQLTSFLFFLLFMAQCFAFSPPPPPSLLNSMFIFSWRLIEMTGSIAHLIPEIFL